MHNLIYGFSCQLSEISSSDLCISWQIVVLWSTLPLGRSFQFHRVIQYFALLGAYNNTKLSVLQIGALLLCIVCTIKKHKFQKMKMMMIMIMAIIQFSSFQFSQIYLLNPQPNCQLQSKLYYAVFIHSVVCLTTGP